MLTRLELDAALDRIGEDLYDRNFGGAQLELDSLRALVSRRGVLIWPDRVPEVEPLFRTRFEAAPAEAVPAEAVPVATEPPPRTEPQGV
jgi:hypothetical protein